jgi:DNA polymerase-3 subunit beta
VKIQLERDVLAEAVQWAARSLPTRPSVPILAGLLVRADSSGVTFSSFDYETSAQISVRATVTDEGEALISGRLLADISRSLPAKPVDITAGDSRMEIVCGSARFTLQTLPVADYPTLPDMPEATGVPGRGRGGTGRAAARVHRHPNRDRGRHCVAAGD